MRLRRAGAAAAAFLLAARVAAGGLSSSAVAVSEDGKLVAAVNPDSDSVTLLSASPLRTLGELKVGRDPRTLCFSADGRLLAVANRGSGDVSIVDVASRRELRRVSGLGLPHGVLIDGKRLFVAESSRASIAVADLETGSVTARVAVEPHPAGLALTPARDRLLATHFFTGRLSVVDAGSLVIQGVVGAPAAANLSQHVAVSPDGRKAYLPLTFSNADASPRGFDTTIVPVVTVADLASRAPLPRERLHLTTARRAVNLPSAAVVSPDGSVLYVANAGTDDVLAAELPSGRILAHIDVGASPRGLALSPDGSLLYAVNVLDGTLSVVRAGVSASGGALPLTDVSFHRPIDTAKGATDRRTLKAVDLRGSLTCASCHAGPSDRVRVAADGRMELVAPPWVVEESTALTRIPLPALVLKGKKVFHSALRPQLSAERWISCASCHPDGGMDGRTWADFPDGARNTPALFGAAETMPLHWSGDLDELQDVEITIRRVHFGVGLVGGPERAPGGDPYARSSPDLDALAVFVASLRAPSPPAAEPDAVRKGEAVYAASGCITCHPSPLYTDQRVHDVGTGRAARERRGVRFDTPSLRSLWMTAPYFHDGSAATLPDVLRSGREHGVWGSLTKEERRLLLAYLGSL